MGQAVQLEKRRWGRGIDTQPCQHGFDADLNQCVRAFWADAELDAGTAPQLEASLVVGVEWEGGGGGGHEPSASFRGGGGAGGPYGWRPRTERADLLDTL